MKNKTFKLEDLLSVFMIWGVVIPGFILLVGGAYFLFHHGGDAMQGHVFTSEPSNLRHPLGILETAFSGGNLAFLQLGVLLLLLNPLFRILLALFGYVREGDRVFQVVCLVLLGVLVYSMFGS